MTKVNLNINGIDVSVCVLFDGDDIKRVDVINESLYDIDFINDIVYGKYDNEIMTAMYPSIPSVLKEQAKTVLGMLDETISKLTSLEIFLLLEKFNERLIKH